MLNFVEGRDIKGEEYHPLRNRIMRAVGIMHRDLENFTFESKEKINHTHYLNNIYP